mmetsp:Transcript_19467/g.23994  ORF Transcript_19467/g.23994 Transcript_19467/m.23994 type:complete len:381 (+) Transcript_19467:231-1373(+)
MTQLPMNYSAGRSTMKASSSTTTRTWAPCIIALLSLLHLQRHEMQPCHAFTLPCTPRTLSSLSSTTSLSSSTNSNILNPLKQGSTCALVTPFLPNGQIDEPSLRSLLKFHKDNNTQGLCVLGTTAEASLLSMQERRTVLEIVVSEVKNKIPILVGTGAINPNDVKSMTQQALDLGADANLVVTPPYIKPPQRALCKFFSDIADCGLPLVVYNVPGRTGVDFKPESIAAIADHELIVGVKEATGDLERVAQIRALTKEKLQSLNQNQLLLYSGDDATEAQFVLNGGDGCISVTANVAPLQMSQMMQYALESNTEEAMKINASLEKIHENIFVESNPIPAKWGLKRMRLISFAYCRPPLCELDKQYYELIEETLREGGITLD